MGSRAQRDSPSAFEKVKKSILKLKTAPIHIHVDLIAGLPYESFE